LETAVGAGLAGLVALGWLVGSALRHGVRALRTSKHRLMLVAFLAGYTGYLTQALFSIDVPPLAMTGWLLVGGVAVLADPAVAAARVRGERTARPKRTRQPAPLVRVPDLVVAGALALATLAALVLVVRPWLADRAAGQALRLNGGGVDPAAVIAAYEDARAWNPTEATYALEQGGAYERRAALAENAADRAAYARQAIRAYRDAERLRPGTALIAVRLASATTLLAQATGVDAFPEADAEWVRAQSRDPFNWEIRRDHGLELILWANSAGGDPELFRRAAVELEVSLYTQPAQPLTWANLGRIRQALGDIDGARFAYVASLRLDPDNESVQDDLDELGPGP
jgi:tetratricopeptide (TPR) repeat protein